MARPLSEEKRNSILSAATEIIAELGIGASTARIAKEAGIAEGTIFTYFQNKDQLLNQLYLELKKDVATELMFEFPVAGNLSKQVKHVWMTYVHWAVANKPKRKAMQQLGVSNCITPETHQLAHEFLKNIDGMLLDLSRQHGHVTPEFLTAIMTSFSETTVNFMDKNPHLADEYAEVGLSIFKSGLELN